jgi:hypothetical protein
MIAGLAAEERQRAEDHAGQRGHHQHRDQRDDDDLGEIGFDRARADERREPAHQLVDQQAAEQRREQMQLQHRDQADRGQDPGRGVDALLRSCRAAVIGCSRRSGLSASCGSTVIVMVVQIFEQHAEKLAAAAAQQRVRGEQRHRDQRQGLQVCKIVAVTDASACRAGRQQHLIPPEPIATAGSSKATAKPMPIASARPCWRARPINCDGSH